MFAQTSNPFAKISQSTTLQSLGELGSNNQGSEKMGYCPALIEAMQESPQTIKTYITLVRSECILHGEGLTTKGWFEITCPIKDESSKANDATTLFIFHTLYLERFERAQTYMFSARGQEMK